MTQSRVVQAEHARPSTTPRERLLVKRLLLCWPQLERIQGPGAADR